MNMSKFENGVAGYVKGVATVEVYFPIDARGKAYINCAQCYYFNGNANKCRLNGEVCQFPTNYVGSNCPLEISD